ncbi:hypothetical protein BC829DRAFT_457813 [Chytridium lagenaria]|nr:hypothetical protein BC829DRAFT_457813 [Chytridium lagenaria]
MSSSSASHPSHPKSTYRLLTKANAKEYFPEWKVHVLKRVDNVSLPTRYFAVSVLKPSHLLIKVTAAPIVPAAIIDAATGAVTNVVEIITEVEKIRQWNEVETSIENVMAFEISLQHDSSQTIGKIKAELGWLCQEHWTPLRLAEEFDEGKNKLAALGHPVTDETYYPDFLLALTPYKDETIGLKNVFKQNKHSTLSKVIGYLHELDASQTLAKDRHAAFIRPGPAGPSPGVDARAHCLDNKLLPAPTTSHPTTTPLTPCPCLRGPNCSSLRKNRHYHTCEKLWLSWSPNN